MKTLLQKLQKDIHKLQTSFQKEREDLLDKIRSLEIKENFELKKRDLEKLVELKFKKFEPTYTKWMKELQKNAMKAGIDLSKLDASLRATVKKAKTTAKKSKLKTSGAKSTKKAKTSKKTRQKSTTKKTDS